MSPLTRARAFEPFFTTKPPGEGTGLGLSMVYGTVINHGGAVQLESEEGAGTAVTLHLPILEAGAPEAREEPEPEERLQRGEGTILLVDDEEKIRGMGRRMLERLGYSVLVAADGEEALRIYRRQGEGISLVVLDLIMPVMDGAETLSQLLELDPEVKVLLSSGYSEERLPEPGRAPFIQKPFSMEVFSRRVKEALDPPRER